MDLHKRIAALERTTGPESPQEIAEARQMLATHAVAILMGAVELPLEPPTHVLAVLDRPMTPEDHAAAAWVSAKLGA